MAIIAMVVHTAVIVIAVIDGEVLDGKIIGIRALITSARRAKSDIALIIAMVTIRRMARAAAVRIEIVSLFLFMMIATRRGAKSDVSTSSLLRFSCSCTTTCFITPTLPINIVAVSIPILMALLLTHRRRQ